MDGLSLFLYILSQRNLKKTKNITTHRAEPVNSDAAGGSVLLYDSPLASTSKTYVVSY